MAAAATRFARWETASAESMLERARQNMQTVSNQKTDPTKSAEGAAPGSQTKVRHDRHRGGFRRSKLK